MPLATNNIKVFVICTSTGLILQVLSKKYVEKQPQAANTHDKGFLRKTTSKSFHVITRFLSKNGILLGIIAGTGGITIKNIPKNINKIPFLGKKLLKPDACTEGTEFFLDLLEGSGEVVVEQSDKERGKNIARTLLSKHLNLDTEPRRRVFIMCFVAIFMLFYSMNPSNAPIVLENLRKALLEGKISKSVVKSIIWRLQKARIPINKELLEALKS